MTGSDEEAMARPTGWFGSRWTLLVVLVVAAALRFWFAASTAYMWDEDRDWVPLAQRIHVSAEDVSLPVRGVGHPALPAYFIRLGQAIAGNGPLGHRLASLIAGLLVIVLASRIARRHYGGTAATWTAILLALNDYHLSIHTLAVEKSVGLLFATLAISAASRFLVDERPRHIVLAGMWTGFGFLCSEIFSLLLPTFFLTLLFSSRRRWLARPAPWIAIGVFFLAVSPDLIWHLLDRGDSEVTVGRWNDHLQRIGSLGLNYQPSLFYGRSVVQFAFDHLGKRLVDAAAEFPSTNPVFGLLYGVTLLAAPFGKKSAATTLFVVHFCFIFGFFTLIKPPSSGLVLDPTLWTWVEMTLIPATILAGRWLAEVRGGPRAAGIGLVIVGAALSVIPALDCFGWARVVASPRPEFPWPVEDQMVPVEVVFSTGWTFDPEPRVELIDMRIERLGRVPADETVAPAVDGYELGTDDRTFRVRAKAATIYDARYRITERSGRTHELSAKVRLDANRDRHWVPPFWAR